MSMFEWLVPLVAVLASAIGAAWLRWSGKRIGKAEERNDAMQKDVENAKRIRKDADEARAYGAGRDAVKRLLDHDRLRD